MTPQSQLTLLTCWELTPVGKAEAWLSHAPFLARPSHVPESGSLPPSLLPGSPHPPPTPTKTRKLTNGSFVLMSHCLILCT